MSACYIRVLKNESIMKSLIYLLAAAGIIGLASCCDKSSECADADACVAKEATTIEVGYPSYYSGTIPAADSEGALYGVALTALSDSTAVYSMLTEYLGAPAPGNKYTDHGDVIISLGTPDDSTAVVYTFVSAVPGNENAYFVATDSTLTMVGSDLRPAETGLSYVLQKKF